MEKEFKVAEIASFDVDAQKGFTPLCPNELPVEYGDGIVEELNKQAKYARLRIGSKDAHPPIALWSPTPGNPQFSKVASPNVDMKWNNHCVIGTDGFDLLSGLPHPIDYDYFVWKGIEKDLHPYGACYHDLIQSKTTGVIEYLICNKIKCVIIGGLATDYCVKTTVLQLRRAGFRVIVNLAACRGISEDTTLNAISDMMDQYVVFVESAKELSELIEKE